MILIVCGLVEAASFIVLQVRYADIGADKSRENELENLYYNLPEYHPYRWYNLPAGFDAPGLETDFLGYRNSDENLTNDLPKIAFFGGSTMYSTMTDRQDAIPDIIREHVRGQAWETVNFGVGGYSSGAELLAFIESVRLVDGIRIAVFYDGVNEVGRFIEKVQDGAASPTYDVMSYPYPDSAFVSIENHVSDYYVRNYGVDVNLQSNIGFPFTWALARSFIDDLVATGTETALASFDVEAAGAQIAEIYLNNARDIAAVAERRDIVPIFILQPTVYEIDHPSAQESAIIEDFEERFDVSLTKAYRSAYQNIRTALAGSGLRFFDLSHALNERAGSQTVFTDYCHLNADGNRTMAAEILAVLSGIEPALTE